MRFLMNENVPRSAISTLRERGHDVIAAKESLKGAADESVLAEAQSRECVLVTQDKDFGELAFRARLPAGCGVVLFRLRRSPEQDSHRIVQVLESRAEWAGHFTVVTDDQVRIRSLPSVYR